MGVRAVSRFRPLAVQFAAFVGFALLFSDARAASEGYVCKILQIQELKADGRFSPYTGFFARYLNSSFSIDRRTGRIIGGPFANENFGTVQVIDHGSKDSSYKHVATTKGPNIWAQYVTVHEQESGPIKPFWGTEDGSYVYGGVCN